MTLPNQESEKIEFKRSISSNLKIASWKAVVAFANTSGGKIYFGINDDSSMSSQKFGDEDLKDLSNFYSQKIDPAIYTSMQVIATQEGDIIEVTVSESRRKIHTFDDVLYIRVWTTNKRCDKNELQNRLIESSWIISTRSWAVCQWATTDDLDNQALNYFIEKIIKENLPSQYDEVKEKDIYDVLWDFGMIEYKDNERLITNDCMILFGKESSVDKLLWEYAIKYRYTQEEDFTNAFDKWVAPDRAIRYAPLITKFEEIEQKIESHNHYLAESTLFRSKEIKQYDSVTIRELLMNSIMHCNWSQEWFIEIEQTINSLRFENHWEYSFNSLLDLAHNPNQFKNYRNKILSKFLFKLGLVEREASWIIAKIVRKQQKKGLSLPIYRKLNWRTRVDILAHITNIDFAKIVMQADNLSINELISLDKIAQGHDRVGDDLDKEAIAILKEKWYIEISGTRYQKAMLSRWFSTKIKKKWLYTKWKWLPRDKALMLIDQHIETFWSIKKSDTRDLFPQLTDDQRSNLLSRSGKYQLHKEWHAGQWFYTKKTNKD